MRSRFCPNSKRRSTGSFSTTAPAPPTSNSSARGSPCSKPRANLPHGAIGIVAMAAGAPASALALASFAGCSPRLKALVFARDELAGALGVDAASAPIAQARAQLVLAAAAAGAPALDAPCADPRDEAALREECRAARRGGFAGKLVRRRRRRLLRSKRYSPSRLGMEAEALPRTKQRVDKSPDFAGYIAP